jgi:hypothetical protein
MCIACRFIYFFMILTMILGIIQSLDALGMVMNFFAPSDTAVTICRENGWVPIEEGSNLYHGGNFVGKAGIKFTVYNQSKKYSWILYMGMLLPSLVLVPTAIVLGFSNHRAEHIPTEDIPSDVASPWAKVLAEIDLDYATRAFVIETLVNTDLTPAHVEWLDQGTAEAILEKAGIPQLGLRVEIMKVLSLEQLDQP